MTIAISITKTMTMVFNMTKTMMMTITEEPHHTTCDMLEYFRVLHGQGHEDLFVDAWEKWFVRKVLSKNWTGAVVLKERIRKGLNK